MGRILYFGYDFVVPRFTISHQESLRKGFPIFVAALNMRAGLLMMSPLIPLIKNEFHLSSLQLSFITSLSVLCFAASAFLMPLVSRIGGTNHVITFFLAIVLGSLVMRTLGTVFTLFLSSLTLGVAIAVLNYSLPVWVKENDPEHSGLLTGIYITVMGVVGAVSIAIAVPLSRLTSWGWRFSVVPFALIALFSTILWVRRIRTEVENQTKFENQKILLSVLRKPAAWSIAIFFGLQSMLFYGTGTWLPTILISKGFSLGHAGIAVSITGFIGSLVGIVVPHYSAKLPNVRGLLCVVGISLTAAYLALIFTQGFIVILWLMIANIGLSITFPLSLLLTVTRSENANETRSLSVMSQAIGYFMATFSAGIIGWIFDGAHDWNVALLFPCSLSLALAGLGVYAGKSELIRMR